MILFFFIALIWPRFIDLVVISTVEANEGMDLLFRCFDLFAFRFFDSYLPFFSIFIYLFAFFNAYLHSWILWQEKAGFFFL